MELKSGFSRFTAIVLVSVLSVSSTGVIAEDGTSGTLPDSFHQCEIVAANWVAPTEAPAASPEASPMPSPVASPVASPMASPVASPVITGEDAEDAIAEEDSLLTADLEAATHAILDCMSDNNLDILLEITGEEFRGSWIGLETLISDTDLAVLLPFMPNLPYELVDIDNVSANGETATATVKFTIGRQLMTSEWTYDLVSINDQNVWKVQRETYLQTDIPTDAVKLSLVIEDGAYMLDRTTISSGDIVMEIVNVGLQPHEVLIVRVPGESTPADFAAAPSGIPGGGTFIAQVTIPAGTGGTIVLQNVRPGTYTVVDLLPGADGMPNVSNGMFTQFTVD